MNIGVHPQTIRNWIRAGQLPVTRFGKGPRSRIRIHPLDLDDMRQASGDDGGEAPADD